MPTLIDVAAAAGVSRSTVSNVFIHPELVRPEVRERVEAVAQAIGFDGPDARGRLLRAGKFNAVGVVMADAAGIAEFIKVGANFVTISALGLLRLGAEDFRQRVQGAL